jgi:hypothetical protein
MALSTRSDTHQTIDVTRARQGRLGRSVLMVLIAAVLLVVIGFFAAWTFKARDLASIEPNNATQRVDALPFYAPPPAAASRQNYTAGGPLAPQNQGNPEQPNRTAQPGTP